MSKDEASKKPSSKISGIVRNECLTKRETNNMVVKIQNTLTDFDRQRLSRRVALSTIGKVAIGAAVVVVIGGTAYYVTTLSGQTSRTTSTSSSSTSSSTSPSSTLSSSLSSTSSTTTSSSPSTTTSVAQPVTIHWLGESILHNIDPAFSSGYEYPIKQALYDTMIRNLPGSSGVRQPSLAKSWTTTDRQVWTMNLQENVKFHDGTIFDANAVAFNMNRVMSLGTGIPSGWLNSLGIKVGKDYDPGTVEVVDKNTVNIHLPAAVSKTTFEGVFAFEDALYIVSPAAVKANEKTPGDQAVDFFAKNGVGTGPYTLTSFQEGQFWIADRFPDYWRGWTNNPTHIDRIVGSAAEETTVEKLDLVSKQYDFVDAFNWPAEVADSVKSVPNVVLDWSGSLSIAHLRLEERGKRLLKDKNLRIMLSYALDYQGAIQSIYSGHVTQAKGPLPTGDFGWSDSLFQYTHDTTKATQYLNAAGYKSGELTLEAIFNQEFNWKGRLLAILQSNLADIGVTLNITKTDSPTYIGGILNNPDGIADIYPFISPDNTYDPVSYLAVLYGTPEPAGWATGYSNSQFTSLVGQMQEETDETKLKNLILQAQQVLIDDPQSVYCWTFQLPRTYWNWVKGFKSQLNIETSVNWWDMYIDTAARKAEGGPG